jgi:hypothetical protein
MGSFSAAAAGPKGQSRLPHAPLPAERAQVARPDRAAGNGTLVGWSGLAGASPILSPSGGLTACLQAVVCLAPLQSARRLAVTCEALMSGTRLGRRFSCKTLAEGLPSVSSLTFIHC